jgi:hypothetical protein
MSRWTSAEDMALLTQANNERPFMLEDGVMKAWDVVAEYLIQVPGFSHAEVDGKKASH